MSEVKLVKFKFILKGEHTWLRWTEELKRRKNEVKETLKAEGVISESCFLSEDGQHVYYFMEAEDLERAKQIATESTHVIDDEHKKIRVKSLEFVEELDCLFHFSLRIDDKKN